MRIAMLMLTAPETARELVALYQALLPSCYAIEIPSYCISGDSIASRASKVWDGSTQARPEVNMRDQRSMKESLALERSTYLREL